MSEPGSKLLELLLDRLYATLVNGPLMSCRPHSSRQRVDLMQLARLRGPAPAQILATLLSKDRSVRLVANESDQAESNGNGSSDPEALKGLLAKLRTIAEDARTYEEDTGTQALFLGFPLLSVPPDSGIGGVRPAKRILAPLAFIPLSITLKATRPAAVTLEAIGDGADLVVPNAALLSWVERMTGKSLSDLFADEEAADPWREINEIVRAVLQALDLPITPALGPQTAVTPTPRSDADESKVPGLLCAGVIGLFPAANQGLLNDLEALRAGERATGPIQSFLKAGTDLGTQRNPAHVETATSLAGSERCVSTVDPCQARAVHLARRVNGLVVHGPPGTGKSQTITNIIGDHLANGERVLFVCDKRTALDVVAYRLERLGLGSLCAVVHDVRRDQRELYRSLKEQLDRLNETTPNPRAVTELSGVDAEITRIHAELTAFESALSERPSASEPSLHELVGTWFRLGSTVKTHTSAELPGIALTELVALESQVKEVMERGARVRYATNPWRDATACDLGVFLGTPFAQWQTRLQRVEAAARRVDSFAASGALPFAATGDAREEGRHRERLGQAAATVLEKGAAVPMAEWLSAASDSARAAAAELAAVQPQIEALATPADRELSLAMPANAIQLPQLLQWLARLNSYLLIVRKWYAIFLFGRRRAARQALEPLGLTLSEETGRRVSNFFERLRARHVVERVIVQIARAPMADRSDAELSRTVDDHVAIFRVLNALEEPGLSAIAAALRRELASPERRQPCVAELLRASERGNAIHELEVALREAGLLSNDRQNAVAQAARAGRPTLPLVAGWLEQLSTVEGVLRVEAALRAVDSALAELLRSFLETQVASERAWNAVKKAVYAAQIAHCIQSTPVLHAVDGDRVQNAHRRYRELSTRRRTLTRDLAQHVWISRQRERLLAATGSRLNSAGANIRQRLVTKGERAMRMRQMIAAGYSIEGGDPLFDLRPVWMTSPDVVAQLFPREPLFDVVIFDEASQCRLEEGLPVLLRAKRVVIAGDPKQLPPTRFFESGVAQSKDQEAEDEQSLFEAQQAEVEDLLGAALNLSVEQAYLDVHYRSQNADLIEFSNQNFYDARLQAIPAHPSSRTRLPPLRLISVGGVYEKRTNPREALEVVKIVKRLLDSDAPPSIGIACFNLSQRDAIAEALDRAAADDPGFGARLAAARVRKGAASFEGLFVRNLESVQGDERDHMIISTTYGPDKQGRFYRRFGPLGQRGGGRRLNVLVTRARQTVHLVTSIPSEIYRSAEAPPPGAAPNGAWLLFAYLRYAEHLESVYRGSDAPDARPQSQPFCQIATIRNPSDFAAAIGEHLAAEHATSSLVHWGNDGFCVDTALIHPERPEDVTLGVLCDGSRFDKAADRVQWDIFRTEVLEAQRWQLFRIWSPEFFRDPEGAITRLKLAVNELLEKERAAQLVERAASADTAAELRQLN